MGGGGGEQVLPRKLGDDISGVLHTTQRQHAQVKAQEKIKLVLFTVCLTSAE